MKNLKELDRPTEIKILPWNIDEEIVSREMLKLLVQVYFCEKVLAFLFPAYS